MKRMQFGSVALALILVATPAWAWPRHPVLQGPTDTMIIGWENHFSLEWSVEPASNHTSRISGYVINRSGEDIDHMRVLAQAFDSSGAVAGKRMSWVLGGVSAGERAYFEIGDVPTAAAYRVTVWDYDSIQS